jgi:cell wall-associated NlpC family hydrolase
MLAKGTVVEVEDDSIEGWYKVNYEGETGYLSSEFVSFSATTEANLGAGLVNQDAVNIRSAASTSSSKIAVVNKDTVVTVTGIENGWYKVTTVSGKVGYIRSDLVDVVKSTTSSRGETTTTSSSSSSSKGSSIVSYAKEYLGVKYSYGGASSKGFDCSGYTMYVMKHFGYSLPHTATGQLGYGTSVAKSDLQAGDLVFFCDPSRSGGKAASHVGIYIGSNQFIHASSGGGKVQINSLSEAYYSQYYIGARRVAS